jgi:predicted dehydrogenase
MKQKAKEHNRILTFGFHFRYGQNVTILKDLIQGGEFGEIPDVVLQ